MKFLFTTDFDQVNIRGSIEKMLNKESPAMNFFWRQASRVQMAKEYTEDFFRYSRYSIPLRREMLFTISGRHLEAQVTKDYHRIEKGMTLPSPKRPFGADAKARLQDSMKNVAMRDAGPFAGYANDALQALEKYNETAEIDETTSPVLMRTLLDRVDANAAKNLLESRRSIRNFDTERSIPLHLIEESVRLAGLSPSVCNRQASHAYYFSGRDAVDQVLSHQSGNRGFGHTAQGVFVVTSDQQMFGGSGERNQSWIDGGLFAMSLVLALHGQGIGTCMLNWSKKNKDTRALRRDTGIPGHENVIVLVAVGYPVPDARVARSPRRPLSEILTVHGKM